MARMRRAMAGRRVREMEAMMQGYRRQKMVVFFQACVTRAEDEESWEGSIDAEEQNTQGR